MLVLVCNVHDNRSLLIYGIEILVGTMNVPSNHMRDRTWLWDDSDMSSEHVAKEFPCTPP
jgi:hypothetical protein